MNFLTAQWNQLILANYTINPNVLTPYLPKGTELDFWNGHCYVSLVGFMFQQTKVLGIRVPKHTDFEEVNLRFYVKRFENGAWKRGVVFIQEIVPKKAITWIANTLYKEHYQTLVMQHQHQLEAEIRKISYRWKSQKKTNLIAVNAYDFATLIDLESEAGFITEHYFGYTKVDENTTFEYEVKHPTWKHYPIKNYQIEVDFKAQYGPTFEVLNDQKPASVFLAEGSEISVATKKRLA